MTLAEIEDRLHEAITTLSALPDRERRFLYGKMTSWPETLREAIDVMALAFERIRQNKSAYEAMEAPRYVPAAEAIDRMDESLPWLALVGVNDQRMIILRAHGVPWTKIADRLRTTEYFVKKWYNAAIITIHGKIEHEQRKESSAA